MENTNYLYRGKNGEDGSTVIGYVLPTGVLATYMIPYNEWHYHNGFSELWNEIEVKLKLVRVLDGEIEPATEDDLKSIISVS